MRGAFWRPFVLRESLVGSRIALSRLTAQEQIKMLAFLTFESFELLVGNRVRQQVPGYCELVYLTAQRCRWKVACNTTRGGRWGCVVPVQPAVNVEMLNERFLKEETTSIRKLPRRNFPV